MRGKKFGSDIPWWIVIFALIGAAPIGVLLAIIKMFPDEITAVIQKLLPKLADYLNLMPYKAAEESADFRTEQRTPKRKYEKQKKLKRRSKTYSLICRQR